MADPTKEQDPTSILQIFLRLRKEECLIVYNGSSLLFTPKTFRIDGNIGKT